MKSKQLFFAFALLLSFAPAIDAMGGNVDEFDPIYMVDAGTGKVTEINTQQGSGTSSAPKAEAPPTTTTTSTTAPTPKPTTTTTTTTFNTSETHASETNTINGDQPEAPTPTIPQIPTDLPDGKGKGKQGLIPAVTGFVVAVGSWPFIKGYNVGRYALSLPGAALRLAARTPKNIYRYSQYAVGSSFYYAKNNKLKAALYAAGIGSLVGGLGYVGYNAAQKVKKRKKRQKELEERFNNL